MWSVIFSVAIILIEFVYCLFVQQVPIFQGLDGGAAVAAGGSVVVKHIVAGGYLAGDAVLSAVFEEGRFHFSFGLIREASGWMLRG